LGTSTLGSGAPSQSTSLPDTGTLDACSAARLPALRVQADALSSTPAAAPPAAAAVAQLQPTGPSPLAGPASPPPSAPLTNGLCESAEDPATPPTLPRPRAATVVPEARKADLSTATVTESVAVGGPHPPPSIHHLPPAPAPTAPLGGDAAARDLKQPVQPPPHTVVPQSSGVHKPSDPGAPSTDGAEPGCAEQPSGSSLENLTPPSASGNVVDHINFFSAREKFQGLAQSRGSLKESQAPPPQEDWKEEPRKVRLPLQNCQVFL